MGKIIAIANQKGGIGKTTTTINLTAAFNRLGRKVLMIDFDPQSSMTVAIGLEPETLDKTIYQAMLHGMDVKRVILKDDTDLLHVMPASPDLAMAEQELVAQISRESKLADLLEPLRDEYDYILIDCPPSLGILTVNALVACDYVIAPLSPEYLALRGFNLIVNTMNGLRRLNPRLELMGVLITMFEGRTTHHKDVLAALKNDYPVFNTMIKKSIKFPDAMAAGLPVQDYDSSFEGAVAYNKLAKEIEEWLKTNKA